MDCKDYKPKIVRKIQCDHPEPQVVELEGQTVAEPINFNKINCERQPQQPKKQEDGPTVADELNARLGMLQVRVERSKSIKPLVKALPVEVPHTYKFQCVCPPFHPTYEDCQHTGQIIIDRDVLTREEHLCFLATPKKNMAAVRKAPYVYHKKVAIPQITARIERLAEPHPMHVQETMKNYGKNLSPRNLQALQTHMEPKPPVEVMTLEKALELMAEEQRLRRVARQMHRRRCTSLKKRILQRQRKQIRKIVYVLFEEMKDFLLNDQFIIDEQSPLCAVILERIRDFTFKEFYTTSNLREYQRILANNLTVWINKFISNLNIYLAPQKIPVRQEDVSAEDPEQFVPLSDYISISDYMGEEEICDGDDDIYCDEGFECNDYLTHDAHDAHDAHNDDILRELLSYPEQSPSEATLV